jgi:hypothetical protein
MNDIILYGVVRDMILRALENVKYSFSELDPYWTENRWTWSFITIITTIFVYFIGKTY